MKLSEHIDQYITHGYEFIKTGFKEIDNNTSGFKPGELCIVGGASCSVRNPFIFGLIRNISSKGVPVALLTSNDYTHPRFLTNIISRLKGEKPQRWYETDVKSLTNSYIKSLPLYLEFIHGATIDTINDLVKNLVENNGVKCIFIDKLQTLFFSKEGTRYETTFICKQLKAIAMKFNVSIIVVSDLNPAVDNRDGFRGKMPVLEDICKDPLIETFADLIMAVYLPYYYGIYTNEYGDYVSNTGIIHIMHNRYSSYCGEINLNFNRYCFLLDDNESDSGLTAYPPVQFDQTKRDSKGFRDLIDYFDLELSNP